MGQHWIMTGLTFAHKVTNDTTTVPLDDLKGQPSIRSAGT